MNLVAQAGGDAYRNERGMGLSGRMLGGVRHRGGGALFAAKMAAVSGIGKISLGGGKHIDTGTYRGMRAAIESGHHSVMEALFKEANRLGGGVDDLNREVFQGLLGGALGVHESDMIYDQMARNKGKMPAPSGKNLDQDLSAVRSDRNMAWRIQRAGAEMEMDVYEKIGEVLRPVATDFKEAALIFADRVSNASDALSFVGGMLEGVADSISYLRNDASGASRAVFEIGISQGGLMDAAFNQALSHIVEKLGGSSR